MKQTKYLSRISEKIHKKYPNVAFSVIIDSDEADGTFSGGYADGDFKVRAAAHLIKQAAYEKKKGTGKVINEVQRIINGTKLENWEKRNADR
jgi:hypothetical protein